MFKKSLITATLLSVVVIVLFLSDRQEPTEQMTMVVSAYTEPERETVSVPNLIGMAENEAYPAIERAKLKSGQSFLWSTDRREEVGRVIEQIPGPKETVPKGTDVQLVFGMKTGAEK